MKVDFASVQDIKKCVDDSIADMDLIEALFMASYVMNDVYKAACRFNIGDEEIDKQHGLIASSLCSISSDLFEFVNMLLQKSQGEKHSAITELSMVRSQLNYNPQSADAINSSWIDLCQVKDGYNRNANTPERIGTL